MKKKKAFRDTSKEITPMMKEFGITPDMSEQEMEAKFLQWLKKEYIQTFNRIMGED